MSNIISSYSNNYDSVFQSEREEKEGLEPQGFQANRYGSMQGHQVCFHSSGEADERTALSSVLKRSTLFEQSQTIVGQSRDIRRLSRRLRYVEERAIAQAQVEAHQTIQKECIKSHPKIYLFHRTIRNSFSSLFVALSALSSGLVDRRKDKFSDYLNTMLLALDKIPSPVPIGTITNFIFGWILDYHEFGKIQEVAMNLPSPEECLQESTKIADKLCEIYEHPIKSLPMNQVKELALFAFAYFGVFLFESLESSTESISEEFIKSLQTRRKTISEEIKILISSIGKSLNPLKTNKEWHASEQFIECGIRTEAARYYANGDKYKVYGFRLGSQEEADSLGMELAEDFRDHLKWTPTFLEKPSLPVDPHLTKILQELRQEVAQRTAHKIHFCYFDPSQSVDQNNWAITLFRDKPSFAYFPHTFLLFEMVKESEYQKVIAHFVTRDLFSTTGQVRIITPHQIQILSFSEHGETQVTSIGEVQSIFKKVIAEAENPLANPVAYNILGSKSSLISDVKSLSISNTQLQAAHRKDPALLKEIFLFATKYKEYFDTKHEKYLKEGSFVDFAHSVHGGSYKKLRIQESINSDRVLFTMMGAVNPTTWVLLPIMAPLLVYCEIDRRREYRDLNKYLEIVSMAQKGLKAFGEILEVRDWERGKKLPPDFMHRYDASYDIYRKESPPTYEFINEINGLAQKISNSSSICIFLDDLPDDFPAARDRVFNRFFHTVLEGMSYKTTSPHNSYTWAVDKLPTGNDDRKFVDKPDEKEAMPA